MKVVGISGPSCSGKSTLARHLRHLLPHAALVYEDDFYLPEAELPLDGAGRPNWDVPKSFDLAAMRSALVAAKAHGTLPAYAETREDKNNPTELLLSADEVAAVRARLRALLGDEPVLLVDGILLFQDASPVADVCDLRLIMPFEYDELRRRRESRAGYATADNGFWVDPPHFFEDVVWPEFVAHCGFLYDGADYTRLSSAAASRSVTLVPQGPMRDVVLRVGELIAGAGARP